MLLFAKNVAKAVCYCGSMAEHFTRNDGVVSSILTSSSKSPLWYHGGDFLCPD